MFYIIGRSVVVRRRTGGGQGPLWVALGLWAIAIVTNVALQAGSVLTQLG